SVKNYFILETQSLSFLLQAAYLPWRSFAVYVLSAIGLLGIGLLLALWRGGIRKNAAVSLLALILSLWVINSLRMIGLLSFFWILLTAYVYGGWLKAKPWPFRKTVEVILLVTGIAVSAFVNVDWKRAPWIGLTPGINRPAEFFKEHKISGPIFNNFDDGSYLIFHLYPQEKEFIDNRLEAFPREFFTKTYIPMQLDRAIWQKMEHQYHFNAIFFSLDTTPWGIKFMRDRFADLQWATVYNTDKAIIWLKRNARNAGIIKHNEIKVLYVQF
ncbi:MAG: hypothetical protein KGJ11_08310, partial [Candidatus Omnitrophica bacterium]|nr:hypothetical protein [Candidatus Omnitrophota bacterium]